MKQFDPQLYLQFGNLLINALEKVPQDAMSPELKEAFANDIKAAKQCLAAQTDEEKIAATEELGKVTDEGAI